MREPDVSGLRATTLNLGDRERRVLLARATERALKEGRPVSVSEVARKSSGPPRRIHMMPFVVPFAAFDPEEWLGLTPEAAKRRAKDLQENARRERAQKDRAIADALQKMIAETARHSRLPLPRASRPSRIDVASVYADRRARTTR
jgi:hypothetical protein